MPELILKAYRAFGELSANTREREIAYKNVTTKPMTDYTASLKDIVVMEAKEITGLTTAINSIASSISVLTQNQSAMKKAMKVYREDSSILAWLFGNWSNDLEIALTKKTVAKDVALVLAKELADFVSVMPGPYPIESFLDRMLGSCKSDAKLYSLVEVVDAVNNDMRKNIIDQYDCIVENPENTPILFSIKNAMEVNKPEIWQHAVSNRTGLDICSIHNSILQWAVLMYFECMLIKEHRM